MVHREESHILRQAGFSLTEIHRLRTFRKERAEEARLQEFLDRRHLEFIRWLVSTGRLTEQAI